MSDFNYLLKKRGLWYRPNFRGYTGSLIEAGKFTREQAMERAGIPGVTVHTLETLISEIDDERRRLRNRLEELDKVERAACGLTI